MMMMTMIVMILILMMTMAMMKARMVMMVVKITMIPMIFCQTNQTGKRDKCPVPELKARNNVGQKASKRNQ